MGARKLERGLGARQGKGASRPQVETKVLKCNTGAERLKQEMWELAKKKKLEGKGTS